MHHSEYTFLSCIQFTPKTLPWRQMSPTTRSRMSGRGRWRKIKSFLGEKWLHNPYSDNPTVIMLWKNIQFDLWLEFTSNWMSTKQRRNRK
mmetsp:Transcript_42846/g.130305  ORF Transcript_42846/g.130305 Transcript_42846/m.130305 type:complete len:90 (+) Transcript_42846:177-446(+)